MGMGTCGAGHVETNLQTWDSDFYGEKAGVSEAVIASFPLSMPIVQKEENAISSSSISAPCPFGTSSQLTVCFM